MIQAKDVLVEFLKATISSSRARRYGSVLNTKRGAKTFLADLPHRFEDYVKPDCFATPASATHMNMPCFVFCGSDFGKEYATISEAYDALSTVDCWLILAKDGTIAIYRPEDRWDDEKIIQRRDRKG